MAVTTQILDHTPIPGHSFPSDNKKRQFTRWVEAKENRQTPFTDFCNRNMDAPEQVEYETGQSYDPAITTTIGTQALNNSATLVLAATTYIRAGDVLRITPYWEGTSGDLDYTNREQATVLSVTNGTDVVTKRHDGAVSSGSWATHAVGSLVEVIARATNYNAAFPDGITWRGDIITNYCQRFDSGEITYDIFADDVPTYESSNQKMEDIAKWRKRLLYYREQAFINGVKLAGDFDAAPKVPYKLGGALWWAQQKSANRFPVGAVSAPMPISIFDFGDALETKWIDHTDGPGTEMWCGPKTRAAMDSLLLPFKEGRLSDTSITNKLTGISTSFGDIKVNHAHGWPEGTILLCAKNSFSWNAAKNQDWKKYERGPEILGAYQTSWNMAGDFGFTCNDVQRLILLEYVDPRKERYAGFSIGL